MQTDDGEVTLSIQTNALALSKGLVEEVGVSKAESERLEKILEKARGALAARLAPLLQEMLKDASAVRVDSAAIERALEETISDVLPQLKEALGEKKAEGWHRYIAANRYLNQSLSIKRSASPPLSPPAGKVRTL